ncbi:fluoride efflux transporter CrcB [Nitratireductor aquimarinus]|uniref:Fluoride-specific ion channel FluC n=1 Tax=Nitratireductor aquimarinus TaxID=889300 RepID=A0ABU4AKY7_9HYPH|nr:fluoride efflux transporter CrcB [Nitratireductor aquimarinus]MDV6226890.1 fluoride efflux transporter CrcB [Nitratireductor aquimarinus]
MSHLLIVAIGGAVGASLRHLTGLAAMRLLGLDFPWGTLTVNLVGSFVMGAFIEWLARRTGASPELRLFMATGLLGGFTTFSAFSLDVAVLWERGEGLVAASYVLVSVCGAIAALFAGLWLVRHFA